MEGERIAMSHRERDRLRVMAPVLDGKRTLREWLVEEGLWKRRRRSEVHRRRRPRRPCRGELGQTDGSHHDWLEGRGPGLVLLVMIDDATSEVVARFYPGETTEAYMDLLGRYVRKHGRPVALYTDGDSILRSEDWPACASHADRHPDAPQPLPTQFGRALEELEVELVRAGRLRHPTATGKAQPSGRLSPVPQV